VAAIFLIPAGGESESMSHSDGLASHCQFDGNSPTDCHHMWQTTTGCHKTSSSQQKCIDEDDNEDQHGCHSQFTNKMQVSKQVAVSCVSMQGRIDPDKNTLVS